MSAGTVVITGGVLAAAILLCIVAVLCYCRLQYYCCRRPVDSESDGASMVGSAEHRGLAAAAANAHSDCQACRALALDGTAMAPISLERLELLERLERACDRCPACSPFSLRAGLLNGGGVGGGAGGGAEAGERLGFHTYYENLPLPPPPPPPPLSPLSPPPPPLLLPLSARHRSLSPLSYYSSSDSFPLPPPPPRPYSTQV